MIGNKQVVAQETLSEKEIRVLSIIAGQTILPENSISIYDLQQAVEHENLMQIDLGLALRRLEKREFLEIESEENIDTFGREYEEQVIFLTEEGWNWVDDNDHILSGTDNDGSDFDNDLPF